MSKVLEDLKPFDSTNWKMAVGREIRILNKIENKRHHTSLGYINRNRGFHGMILTQFTSYLT